MVITATPTHAGGWCTNGTGWRDDHDTAEPPEAPPLQHSQDCAGDPRRCGGGEEGGRAHWSPDPRRGVMEAACHCEAFEHQVRACERNSLGGRGEWEWGCGGKVGGNG